MEVLRKYSLMFFAALLISLFFVKDNIFIDRASNYTTEIAKDSGTVYLSLRGINAALSFVEEIEVNASVVIASGSVHPFKVLEPIDDAVERMSSAVFHIGVVAASLTVVLDAFGRIGFLLFGLALGAQQLSVQFGWIGKNSSMNLILDGVRNSSAVILMALAAFFVSSMLSDKLSDSKWLEYKTMLNEIAADLDEISVIDQVQLDEIVVEEIVSSPASEQDDSAAEETWSSWILDPTMEIVGGALDRGGEMVDGVRNLTNGTMNSMVEKYNLASEVTSKFWERKDQLIEALTAIFALFLFKTFILPVIIFLLLYGSVKGTFTHKV